MILRWTVLIAVLALLTTPVCAQELLISTTPLNLVIDQPSRADFVAGWKYEDDGLQVHIETPDEFDDWTVTIHTDDLDLGPVDNSWDKDLFDLEFMGPANATWKALGDDPQHPDAVVATGTGNDDFFVDWRVRLRWLYDRPGEYGATLILTLALD